MNIVVVLRQLPDLIEPLEIDESGSALDLEFATFIVNEYDEHALEQALLLKEAHGGQVTVVALDYGEVDNTLYAAAAKGADRVIKIPYDDDNPPLPKALAAFMSQVIRPLDADLILVGVQSYDELEGNMAPLLAVEMKLPYLGLIQGVEGEAGKTIKAYKEFPGASKASMSIQLPAVLGILTASQPPRYVPISRIRSVMKSIQFDEQQVELPAEESLTRINRLYPPETGERAEILEGDTDTISSKLIEIMQGKGVLK